MKEQLGYSENLTPLLPWIHLIDVHQNVVFEMEKNRGRPRVPDNRCNRMKRDSFPRFNEKSNEERCKFDKAI